MAVLSLNKLDLFILQIKISDFMVIVIFGCLPPLIFSELPYPNKLRPNKLFTVSIIIDF